MTATLLVDDGPVAAAEPAPAAVMQMPPRLLFAMRLLFVALFLTSIGLITLGVAAQWASYSSSFLERLRDMGLEPTFFGDLADRVADASRAAESGPQFGLDIAFSLVNLGLAGFLFWLRPRDVAGAAARRSRSSAPPRSATSAPTPSTTPCPRPRWEAASHDTFTVGTAILYAFAVVVFPDGRLVPMWSRPRAHHAVRRRDRGVRRARHRAERAAGRAVVLVTVFGLGVPFVGLAAQAYRYRHPATATHRQLSRLLVLALTVALLIGVFAVLRGVQNADASRVRRPRLPDPCRSRCIGCSSSR